MGFFDKLKEMASGPKRKKMDKSKMTSAEIAREIAKGSSGRSEEEQDEVDLENYSKKTKKQGYW